MQQPQILPDNNKLPIFIGPQRNLLKCKIDILLHNLKLIKEKIAIPNQNNNVQMMEEQKKWDNDNLDLVIEKLSGDNFQEKSESICRLQRNEYSDIKSLLTTNRDTIKKNAHQYADAIYFPEGCGNEWSLNGNKEFMESSIQMGRPAILLCSIEEEKNADSWKKGKESFSIVVDEILWLKDGNYSFHSVENGMIVAIPTENNEDKNIQLKNHRNSDLNQQRTHNLETIVVSKISETHYVFFWLYDYIEKFNPTKPKNDSNISFYDNVNIDPIFHQLHKIDQRLRQQPLKGIGENEFLYKKVITDAAKQLLNVNNSNQELLNTLNDMEQKYLLKKQDNIDIDLLLGKQQIIKQEQQGQQQLQKQELQQQEKGLLKSEEGQKKQPQQQFQLLQQNQEDSLLTQQQSNQLLLIQQQLKQIQQSNNEQIKQLFLQQLLQLQQFQRQLQQLQDHGNNQILNQQLTELNERRLCINWLLLDSAENQQSPVKRRQVSLSPQQKWQIPSNQNQLIEQSQNNDNPASKKRYKSLSPESKLHKSNFQ